jgi:Flp pilus assembly protein TadD
MRTTSTLGSGAFCAGATGCGFAVKSMIPLMTVTMAASKASVRIANKTILNSFKYVSSILLYPKPEKGDVKLSRALNQQGLAAFSQENFTNAASLFLDAARANPADIEVLNNYAYALLKSGNNQLAQQVLGYVLSLAPGRTSAWANLGEVYANLNRIDASAASLVVGFQFSGNKEKTLEFFNKTSESTSNNALKSAITKALSQLSSS